jgi:hypothetical protein
VAWIYLRRLTIAIAIAAVTTAATFALGAALSHVRQQSDLTRTLHSASDLALVPAAGAGDSTGADLAAVRDEPAQSRDVLVVDLLDLVAAVRAWLTPTR